MRAWFDLENRENNLYKVLNLEMVKIIDILFMVSFIDFMLRKFLLLLILLNMHF